MTRLFMRAAALAATLALAASCETKPMEPPPPEKPRPAPAFTLPSTDGKTVSLSDFSGKPVMINFWASWCVACIKEMPELERIHKLYRDRGLSVVLINMQETAETAKKQINGNGYTMTSLLDEKGELAEKYQVFGLPTTFFVDKAGVIHKTHMGELTREIITDGLTAISAH